MQEYCHIRGGGYIILMCYYMKMLKVSNPPPLAAGDLTHFNLLDK